MSAPPPDKPRKRGAPPVVTLRRRPPPQPYAPRSQSFAVKLAAFGVVALGSYEFFGWLDRKLNCEPDPNNPQELICKRHNGSSYRHSSSWSWGSSSGSSHSSSSYHGLSFGGFGHYGGGFHSSGG